MHKNRRWLHLTTGVSNLLGRWRYDFDNFMSQGTIALISGLALVSLVFIVLMAAVVSLTGIAPAGGDRLSLPEALWGVLMRTLDSGTVGGDTGWTFRLTMLFVTFGGIFVVSTLIGLLSSGIDSKLEDLRKGRSRVIEHDHIVILGWSLQIFTLVTELALANANHPDPCLVILSGEDKVEMETALTEVLGKPSRRSSRLRWVCRTGNPSSMADLGLVNIQTARSIIVLTDPAQQGDIALIKTLLAITSIPRSHPQPYHIVAQVQSPKTLEVLRLVAQDRVEALLTHDLISRIVVQTCRQSGLSTVYLELLDFRGNEIYFRDEPALVGRSYGQAQLAYPNAAVIGIRTQDGAIALNPDSQRDLQSGDQLILISEDDDTMILNLAGLDHSTHSLIDTQAIQVQPPPLPTPEHTLILGWNDRVYSILILLDQYVATGSTVTILATSPAEAVDCSPQTLPLVRQTLDYQCGDPTDRTILAQLDWDRYDHVLVLYDATLETEQADAQTLVTLLHLRDICDRDHYHFQIVTEILDIRNQALAQIARPDDFVISEQIISLMLAQVAEQKQLNTVLTEIFSPEGCEIYLKPAAHYVTLDRPVNFYTVVAAAQQRGESVIGYRRKALAHNLAQSYGIVLNPPKDQPIPFDPEDQVIVLSES